MFWPAHKKRRTSSTSLILSPDRLVPQILREILPYPLQERQRNKTRLFHLQRALREVQRALEKAKRRTRSISQPTTTCFVDMAQNAVDVLLLTEMDRVRGYIVANPKQITSYVERRRRSRMLANEYKSVPVMARIQEGEIVISTRLSTIPP
jgi:hypothetical protein